MKVTAPQLSEALRNSDRVVGLLLHGSDLGLVRERAVAAARGIAAASDPFSSCVLTKEEHSRLPEEAASRSMLGGRRVIRVLDAVDALASVLGRLELKLGDALVILEAGILPPRSKLRQFSEKATGWASLACYPETGSAFVGSVRRLLEAEGFAVEHDAASFLSHELSEDTVSRRSELAKLALFASGAPEIDLAMATQCCARFSDASVDRLLSAAMGGDVASVARTLPQVLDDGASGPGLIAALTSRTLRLLKVRLEMQAGQAAEYAVRELQPPVFFRDVSKFVDEVRRWSCEALTDLLAVARAADLACKRAGSNDGTIGGQLYLLAARRASRPDRAS